VPDQYVSIRTLPFSVLGPALGADLNKFKIRKSGQEHYGPCPIHNPTNNSTSFSYLSDGRFNCFSCNAKGSGAIDLTMKVKGIGFKEAVAFLEPFVGMKPKEELSKEKSPVVDDSGALKPFTGKYDKYAVPCEWLEKRIPDEAVRKRYGVFQYFNPSRQSAYSHRVMIPIRDLEGVLYGYLGRSIEANREDTIPKYLFPPNLPKSRFLFGAHELTTQLTSSQSRLPVKLVYLVESPFAVMKFAMLGLPAVSPYGWSLSSEQLDIASSLARGLVLLPDRNKFEEFSLSVGKLAQRCWVRLPHLPEGVDDPEYLPNREAVLALHS
jgi:DNA primase